MHEHRQYPLTMGIAGMYLPICREVQQLVVFRQVLDYFMQAN
jgi:hypothetical protein